VGSSCVVWWRRLLAPATGRTDVGGAVSQRCRLTTSRDEQAEDISDSAVVVVAVVGDWTLVEAVAAGSTLVVVTGKGWTSLDGDRDALSAS